MKFNHFFRENRFREARDYFRSRFDAPPTGFKEVEQLTEEKLNTFNRWSEACLYLGEENSGFQALKHFVEDLEKNSHKNWSWLKTLDERLAIEITESVIHLANFYFYFGKYAKSLDLAELSKELKENVLDLAKDTPRNARSLARTSVVMGKAFWKLGNFYDAILSFLRSIEYLIIADTYNNDEEGYMVGRCFCLLGEVYLDLNSLELAEDLLNRSLDIMEKRSKLVYNHLYVGIANNVLGRILAKKGKAEPNPQKAEGLFLEARKKLYDAKYYLHETFTDAPFHRYIANNLCNIAMRDWYCFYRLTEPEIQFSASARKQFNEVVTRFKDEIDHREKCFDNINKYHGSKANAHINLAKVYLLSNLLGEAKASSLSAIKTLAPELGEEQWSLPMYSDGRRMKDISWITLFKALEVHLKILWKEFSLSLDTDDCPTLSPSQQSLYDQGMNVSRLCLEIYNDVLNNGNSSPLKDKDPGIVRMLYSRQASLIIELRLKFLYTQYQCYDQSNADSTELNNKVFQSFRTQRNIFLSSVNNRVMGNNEDDTNSLFNKTEKSIIGMLKGLTGEEQTNKAQKAIILATIKSVTNEQEKLKKQIKIRSDFVASLGTQKSSQESMKNNLDDFNLNSIYSHFEKAREGKILSYVLGEDSLFVMIIGNKNNVFDFKNLLAEHPNPKQAIDDIKSSTYEIETIINNTIWEIDGIDVNRIPNRHYAKLKSEINSLDATDLNVVLYNQLIKLNSFLIAPLDLREDKRIYVIPDGELNFLNFGLLTPDIIESKKLLSNDSLENSSLGIFKFSELAFLDRRIEVSYAISSESLYSNHVHETAVAPKPINGALSMVVTGRVSNEQKFVRTPESDIFVNTYKIITKLAPNQHTTFDSTQLYNREDFYQAYSKAVLAYLHVHAYSDLSDPLIPVV